MFLIEFVLNARNKYVSLMLRAEWARGKYSWFPILFLPTIILWSKVWNYKLKLRTQYFLSADDHFMIKGLKFEFEKCTLCPKHIIWRGQIVPQTYNANVIFCQRSIRLTVWKSLEHKSSRDRIVLFGNQLSI